MVLSVPYWIKGRHRCGDDRDIDGCIRLRQDNHRERVGRTPGLEVLWDEFHPQANITKMGKGIPLSDEDRQPWLNALKKLIDQLILKQESAVIACSALKEAYRETLKHKNNEVCFVYLKGEYELIEKSL
jgi:carbohydrate kinase (thermoresistant glucokinase family)